MCQNRLKNAENTVLELKGRDDDYQRKEGKWDGWEAGIRTPIPWSGVMCLSHPRVKSTPLQKSEYSCL